MKVRNANIALFLHQDQLMRFNSLVRNDAKVFIDESFVKEVPKDCRWAVFKAPYKELAEQGFKTIRVSNMIALGHLVGTLRVVAKESIEKAIDEVVEDLWREVNKAAFNLGLRISSDGT